MLGKTLNILHVEDDPQDALLLAELLNAEMGENAINITCTDKIQEAPHLLEKNTFNAILLDLNVSDSFGLNSVMFLKEQCHDIPIIVLTGVGNDVMISEALQTGAQDYFIKNKDSASLLKRAIFYSIERMKMETELHQKATHDSLTGLANRTLFNNQLDQAMARSQRHNKPFALMYADLDKFKAINDTLGHQYGDIILKQVADRLLSCTRKMDTVARLGGDEFAIILEDLTNPLDTKIVAERIITEVAEKGYWVNDYNLDIAISIGIALYPTSTQDRETLLDYADKAMFDAKKAQNYFYKYATGEFGGNIHAGRYEVQQFQNQHKEEEEEKYQKQVW